MDYNHLRKHMVLASDDSDDNDMNLAVITNTAGYKLAQNMFRMAVPDEQSISKFPSFLIKLDRLLSNYVVNPQQNQQTTENEDTDQQQETDDAGNTEDSDSEDDSTDAGAGDADDSDTGQDDTDSEEE